MAYTKGFLLKGSIRITIRDLEGYYNTRGLNNRVPLEGSSKRVL